MGEGMNDPINPDYYKGDGVQHYELAQWMPYLLAQASKYLMRAGKKDAMIQEYQKANWYIEASFRQLATMSDDPITLSVPDRVIEEFDRLAAVHHPLIIECFANLIRCELDDALAALTRLWAEVSARIEELQ